MDELSPAAQIIGAVNTIVNDNGKLTGHITDGEGFVHNLRDHGIEIKGKKITVAGGGGAATAIQVQCALDGAREISIFNIKDAFFERTLQTAEKIRKAVPECVVNVYDIADIAKMTEEIQSSDIFANATIVGMKPMDDQSVVKDLSAFRPGLVVADAVYNPEETKLLREAKEAGCTCIGGKGMLLWQGVAAFKLYTGQDMPVEDVKKLFFQLNRNGFIEKMSRQKYFTFAGFLDLGNIINIISGETQSILCFPFLLIWIGFIWIFDHCVCRTAGYIGASAFRADRSMNGYGGGNDFSIVL